MLAYTLILLPFLSGLLATKKLKNLFYYISLISLIFFCGFRFDVGNDYYSYSEIYNFSGTSFEIQSVELMFSFLMHIANLYGLGFNTFLFVFSASMASIFFGQLRAIYKNYSIPIFLFVLNDMPIFLMSIIRQGMAVALIFVATYFLWKQKYLKFLILVCLALTFHIAAIYFILFILAAYAVSLIKIKSTKLILIFFLVIYIIAFQMPQVEIFELVNSKFDIYKEGYDPEGINFFLSNYFIFKVSIIAIYLFYFYKKNLISYESGHLFILLFSIVSNIIFYGYGEINLRMGYFFNVSLIVLSSYIIINSTKKIRPYISIYIFTYFLIHYFKFIFLMRETFIPYRNFLFHG